MAVAGKSLRVQCAIAAAISLAVWIPRSTRAADDDVKQSCIEAHGLGQDELQQGHIALARAHFHSCAQLTCPALVKDDCARLLDEAERALPSLSFSARDARGRDLPDTRVFLDGEMLVSRLDGLWHDVDPGSHVVRFEHAGEHQEHELVVAAGEKGRLLVGVFEDAPQPRTAPRPSPTARPRLGPALALGTSASLVAVGGALLAVGLSRLPDRCSLSEHECAAPPGDPAFKDASDAVRLSNVGWVLTGAGLAALTASLIWYFKAAGSRELARSRPALSPFATAQEAGLSLSGRM